MGCIYALSLDGFTFRYVGQTVRTVEQRLRAHQSQAEHRGTNWPVHCWMRKHGPFSVVVTLLEEAERADLGRLEREWMVRLREQGFDLLNLTEGGNGGCGPLSEEHKERLRYERTEETRRRMSESAKRRGPNNKGHRMSEEQKAKISAANKGRKRTPEQRAALSAAAPKTKSPEHAAKISAALKAYHERKRNGLA